MKNKGIVKAILLLSVLACAMFTFFACEENNEKDPGKKEESRYTLSFFADGKTYHTLTTDGAQSVTLPANPGKTGYRFDGWYFDRDVWQNEFHADSLTTNPIQADTTVYAKYSVINYTIVYHNAEGTTNTNPAVYNIETATINLAQVSKDGYTFDGWFDQDGNQVTEIAKGTTGDIELTARWTASAPKTTVTKTEWEKLFSSQNYTVTQRVVTDSSTSYGDSIIIKMDGDKMLRDFPQEEEGTLGFAEVVAGKEGYRMVAYDKKTGELVSEWMESGSLREFDECISIFADKFDLFSYDSEKEEYVCADGAIVYCGASCRSVTVKIENGKLVQVMYLIGDGYNTAEIVVTEVGTTTVTLPTASAQ